MSRRNPLCLLGKHLFFCSLARANLFIFIIKRPAFRIQEQMGEATLQYLFVLLFFVWGWRGFGTEPESELPQYLSPTIYYKPVIKVNLSSCSESDVMSMLSPENKILVKMCSTDLRRCLLEGACYVSDDLFPLRLFNYISRNDKGEPQFKQVDLKTCPYGLGIRNTCLDPYFTVAADLKFYKLGDVIFVPLLVGVVMPDGQSHDGYFVVRDAGAAIKGPSRFDFYTGLTKPFDPQNPFYKLGFMNKENAVVFRKATEEETRMILKKTRYPKVRREIFVSPMGI